MNPQTFNDAVEAGRIALGPMANGDADRAPRCGRGETMSSWPTLWSTNVGYPPRRRRMDRWLRVVGGEPHEFDEIVRWSSEDLGYVLAIGNAQAQLAGSGDLVTLDLRVTTIFRREELGGASASATLNESPAPGDRTRGTVALT